MDDWILLIEFGTSFSRVAILAADGHVHWVEVDGALATPSGIWADSSGALVAGLPAQRQARLAPERWDRAPGRSLNQPSLRLGPTEVAPPAAVAAVLKRLSAAAIERQGGVPPAQVRLLCPARWTADRRDLLLSAARLVGLGSVPGGVQFVDAPIAIARYLAGRGRFAAGAKVALFDLGGGDLDTAVLESTGPGTGSGSGPAFVVRALGGIAGLGGELFDDLIYREVTAHALTGWDAQLATRLWEPPDAQWRRAAEGLFREVRWAKEDLSRHTSVPLDTGPLIDTPLTLDRSQVETLLRAPILRGARELAATIELAGLRPRALDAVFLIGGSSRIPLVARAIFDVIGVRPTLLDEPSFLGGAAGWTASDRIDPVRTAITESGRDRPAGAPIEAGSADRSGTASGEALLALGGDGSMRAASAPAWRRRPLVATAAVAVLVGGSVLTGVLLTGRAPTTGARPVTAGPPTSNPTGTPAPAAGTNSLPPVTGLSARTKQITVELRWDRVRGAASYLVYRDHGTPVESVRAVAGTSFGDRPGDGDEHAYAAVPLDAAGRSGPVGTEVRAVALAPYGDQQGIASAWTAVVPARPGLKGTAGQVCEGEAASSDFSTGRIRCSFGNGVGFEVLRYASEPDRRRRGDQLAAGSGVHSQGWDVPWRPGFRATGRLLTASASAPGGPWRWWSYDSAPTYAMYADWPGHSAKELTVWWRARAPFRT